MGTRKNRLGEAVLTCTHNVCFEQHHKIIIIKKSIEFFSPEELLCMLHEQVFIMSELSLNKIPALKDLILKVVLQ